MGKVKETWVCPNHNKTLILINVNYGNNIEGGVVKRSYRCPELKCEYRLERKEDE